MVNKDMIKNTELYKTFVATNPPSDYIANVERLCDIAITLSSDIVISFNYFTRHDYIHIINVLKIMADLLGEEGLGKISQDEAAMLLLVGCWHDVGMCVSKKEKERLLGEATEWNEFFGKYPDKALEFKRGTKTKEDLIPELVRSIHYKRLEAVLVEQGLWKNWPLNGQLSKKDFCNICRSHGEPLSAIRDVTGFNCDVTLCAVLLRLADILDFDSSRAPLELFYSRGLDNVQNDDMEYSKGEWCKHLSSDGFRIDGNIVYCSVCKNPNIAYEINKYIDWVDCELEICSGEIDKSETRKAKLKIQDRVIRSIEYEGFDSAEFHFSLEHDAVIDLLKGRNVYNGNDTFIRELLQNSIDAVRTRRAILLSKMRKYGGTRLLDENEAIWEPKIVVKSWSENGFGWISIDDNGIGMNKHVVSEYFLNIAKLSHAQRASICQARKSSYLE